MVVLWGMRRLAQEHGTAIVFGVVNVILRACFCIWSGLPFAIGQVQDAGLIFLSKISSTVARGVSKRGGSEADIVSTTLVAYGDARSRARGYFAFIGFFCVEAGLGTCIADVIEGPSTWSQLWTPTWNLVLAIPGALGGLVLMLVSRRHYGSSNDAALPLAMLLLLVLFVLRSGLDVAAVEVNIGKPLDVDSERIRSKTVGWCVVLAELAVVAAPTDIFTKLPLYFFAATLAFVGIDLLREWLREAREKYSARFEYAASLVTFVAIQVVVGLDAGLLVGLVAASFVFLISASLGSDEKNQQLRRAQPPVSTMPVSPEEADVLEKYQDQVVVVELRGQLWWGTAASFLGRIKNAPKLSISAVGKTRVGPPATRRRGTFSDFEKSSGRPPVALTESPSLLKKSVVVQGRNLATRGTSSSTSAASIPSTPRPCLPLYVVFVLKIMKRWTWLFCSTANPFSIVSELTVRPAHIAVGDFDGDSVDDVVSSAKANVFLHTQVAGGWSTAWSTAVAEFYDDFDDVVAVDVDDDGVDDVVVSAERSVLIFFGSRLPWGEWNVTRLPACEAPKGLAGAVDGSVVRVAIGCSDEAWLYACAASCRDPASWTNESVAPGLDDVGLLKLVDVDGDSDVDAIVAHRSNLQLVWLENPGWGVRPIANDSSVAGSKKASSIGVGDLDGDSSLDVVSVVRSLDLVLWHSQGRNWSTYVVSEGFTAAEHVMVSDVDSDTRPDVVVAAKNAAAVGIFYNRLFAVPSLEAGPVPSRVTSLISARTSEPGWQHEALAIDPTTAGCDEKPGGPTGLARLEDVIVVAEYDGYRIHAYEIPAPPPSSAPTVEKPTPGPTFEPSMPMPTMTARPTTTHPTMQPTTRPTTRPMAAPPIEVVDGVAVVTTESELMAAASASAASTIRVHNITLTRPLILERAVVLEGGTLASENFGEPLARVLADATLSGLTFDGRYNTVGCVVVEAGAAVVERCSFVRCREVAALRVSSGATVVSTTFDECEGGALAATAPVAVSDFVFRGCRRCLASVASELIVSNSVFVGGYATGADYVYVDATGDGSNSSSVAFRGCVFKDVDLSRTTDGDSAVILKSLSRVSLENCTFRNIAAGAVDNVAKIYFVVDVFVVKCTFVSNDGAQVLRVFQLYKGTFQISNSTFDSNAADDNGVGLLIKEAPSTTLRVDGSVFREQSAPSYQGAALWLNSNALISRPRFVANSAMEGGAIYVYASVTSVEISDSEFVSNEATDAGGAIAMCSTSQTFTFSGVLVLSMIRALANLVSTRDDEKSGGGFAKINGGTTVVRDAAIDADNLAGGVSSGVGLRYADAEFYSTIFSGPSQHFFVALDTRVTLYCVLEPPEFVAFNTTFRNHELKRVDDECSLCLPGSKAKTRGDSKCVSCGPGTFAPNEGQESCDPSPAGSIPDQDRTSVTECVVFGSNLCSTARSDACSCCDGYYADASGSCVECTNAMDCTGFEERGQGATLVDLKLKPKYYRRTRTSTKAFRCPGGAAACPGGTDVGDAICPGYYGVAVGSGRLSCRKCRSQTGIGTSVVYGFLFIAILALIIWFLFTRSGSKIFMRIAESQVEAGGSDLALSAFPSVFSATFRRHVPSSYLRFSGVCYSIVTVAVADKLMLLIMHMLLPFCANAAVGTLIYESYEDREYLRAALDVDVNSKLYKAFILPYGIFATIIYPIGFPLAYGLTLFRARHILNPKQIPIAESPPYPVGQAGRDGQRRPVQFRIFSPPTLDPQARDLRLQTALVEYREKTIDENPDFAYVLGFSFLWSSYEPRCYYWDVVELVVRLFYTALVGVVDDSGLQIAVALLVAIFYMSIFSKYEP
ncbi:hypothetical protein CTAYLR_010149 [Chrysophaeum taylorii]|uniref:Right handed beta helix domain-containing protein n=1 Tax=Chrysophaeum taylorii TaxID=2483200 RepID=A0AAD7UHK6_9STRA|nr:hypothetical protein CTAYLR_010149 [Chrysophaeum taylorii]